MNRAAGGREPPRSNPFVLGADTWYRFGLLVAAVVGITPLLTAPRGYAIVPGALASKNDEEACIQRLLQGMPDVTGKALVDRLETMGRYVVETCHPHVSAGMGLYTIAMIAAVFVLALAIYWWIPRRLIRRRRLTPLPPPSALPEVHRQLDELTRITGVGEARFLFDPLDRRVTGLAFGRVGRRHIVLSRGLVHSATTDPARFRAVMLHELAHVRNGDIDPTYLTIAVWRSWVILVLVPAFASAIVSQLGGVVWRLVVTALLVRMVRDATLRSREHYADARAARWGTPEILHRALSGRALPRRFARRWGWGNHPEAEHRRAALTDPSRVIAVGFGDGLALGTTTVYSLTSLTLIAGWLSPDPPGEWVHLAPFTALLACALTFGIFRVVLAAGLTGRPTSLGPLGIGLGTGFVLGTFVTPGFGVRPSDVPLSGDGGMPSMPPALWLVWAGLMVAGALLTVQWITDLLAAWLPYAASRRTPLPTVLGCAAVTAVVLTAWLAFALDLPSSVNMTARMVFPDVPQVLVFLGVLIVEPAYGLLAGLTVFVVLLWAAPFAATARWVRAGPPRTWVSLTPLPETARLAAPRPIPARGVQAGLIAACGVTFGLLTVYLLVFLAVPPTRRSDELATLLVWSGMAAGVLAQILAVVLAVTVTRTLRLPHAMLAATLANLPAGAGAAVAMSLASCATGPCVSPLAITDLRLMTFLYPSGLVVSLLVAMLLILRGPQVRGMADLRAGG
ncbi:M48 family metalloprotease [Microbispora sp. NPDC046933]|uniref:M48 family metalloprotease n=1 Tax=Microbispora sp. NPDC046933 TaxID=3155618 RepID=UPI003407330D